VSKNARRTAAKSRHAHIRLFVAGSVAGSVNAPVDLLKQLATDEDPDVRTAVWLNQHASDEIREMAARLGVSTDSDAAHSGFDDDRYDYDHKLRKWW